MKKNLLFVIAILVYAFNSNAQVAVKWQKTYGGSGDEHIADDSNYYDSPDHAIAKTTDGGFIITGITTSSDGDFTGVRGGNDIGIVKSDSAGNVEWSVAYGGSSDDQATSIIQTLDGGYAICGFTSSNDGVFSSTNGSYDIFILRIDNAGNLISAKNFGTINEERAYTFYQSSDSNFVVGGFTYDNNYDYWIFKTDTAGTIMWEKSFIGNDRDWLNAMAPTADGGSIICGFSFSSDSDFVGSFGGSDYWVIKLDDQGQLQWKQNYGGAGNDWAFDITPTSDGGYAVAGLTEGDGGQVSGTHGGHDYWIIKIDSQGALQWQKAIGGSLIDECYEIIETSDHGLMIAGTSNSFDGDVQGNLGLLDFYLTKVDASGNVLWNKTYGGSQSDWALSIVDNGNDEYLIFGNTKSNDYDVTFNHGGWDFWVLKLSSAYNAISGHTYFDANSDNVFNAGDLPLGGRMVKDVAHSIYAFSDSSGYYEMQFIDTGSFIVVPEFIANFNVNPTSYAISIPTTVTIDTANDFAYAPIPGINDLQAAIIPLDRFRPGFGVSYLLTVTNVGTVAANGSVYFIPDGNLTFDSATVAPDTIIGDTLIWYNFILNPMESESIIVYCTVNANCGIGTSITSSMYVEDGTLDSNEKDNSSSWTSIVTGSYDPNDKAVNTDRIYTNQIADMPFLNYMIRFQNTGNDTAFTVVVRDTISAWLNMDSFKLISSSHTVNVQYSDINRLLTFTFPNILLVDSTTNEGMSHGYVSYKILPYTSIQFGDQIDNTAYIYFDFNAPIITNTAMTSVMIDLSVKENYENNIIVFPNPTADNISFKLMNSNGESKIEIIDANSRVVMTKRANDFNGIATLNTTSLKAGVYFIRIVNGEKTLHGKFVKQ